MLNRQYQRSIPSKDHYKWFPKGELTFNLYVYPPLNDGYHLIEYSWGRQYHKADNWRY